VGTVKDDGLERGLLFVAFIRSIGDQFGVLVNDRMNSTVNPAQQAVGFDVLVGQKGAGRRRRATLPHGQTVLQVSNEGLPNTDWVFPTCGGYFFAPSLSALRLLEAP
jgi:hypothetical protein